jgi:hypothetical protein
LVGANQDGRAVQVLIRERANLDRRHDLGTIALLPCRRP